MKIRLDFVSNSSSSSFMIVGLVFNYDDLVKIAEHNKLTSTCYKDGENDCDWDSYEIVSELEKKFPDIEFNHGIENYYESYCIGLGYDKMKPDETKKEFEERIAKALSEMTGTDIRRVDCLVDGGRDD